MQTSSPRPSVARLLACAVVATLFAACSASGDSLTGPRGANAGRATPTAAVAPQATGVGTGGGEQPASSPSAGQSGSHPDEPLPYYIVAY